MLKVFVAILGLMLALPLTLNSSFANQVPKDVQSHLQEPEKIGEVKVRFLGIRMYDAALFTKQGNGFQWSEPFALALTYARTFSRERLVKASLSELERVEGARPDHQAIGNKLASCFRSVRASDRFVAIPISRNQVRFYFNGRATCVLRHSGIRERFLGIWLSDTSRDKRMSRALRGAG